MKCNQHHFLLCGSENRLNLSCYWLCSYSIHLNIISQVSFIKNIQYKFKKQLNPFWLGQDLFITSLYMKLSHQQRIMGSSRLIQSHSWHLGDLEVSISFTNTKCLVILGYMIPQQQMIGHKSVLGKGFIYPFLKSTRVKQIQSCKFLSLHFYFTQQ